MNLVKELVILPTTPSKSRQMGKGHTDARIGAMYYRKSGYNGSDDQTPEHY